jgi:hypothetical protein
MYCRRTGTVARRVNKSLLAKLVVLRTEPVEEEVFEKSQGLVLAVSLTVVRRGRLVFYN